jgi:hypothetical protein
MDPLDVRPVLYNANMCSRQDGREEGVRAALEAYPKDPSRLSDEEAEQGFAELQCIAQAVEAKKLAWLANIERRASFRQDGYLSTTDWLSDRFNLTRGSAKEQIKTAEALEALPRAREALQAGEVSPSAVRVPTAAWESHPEAFEANGSSLLDEAKEKPIGDLRRVVEDWRHRQDQNDGLEQTRKARERRRLDICPTASGMVRVDGELDPEGGEHVMTALQAMVDADVKSGPTDLRTPRQRRADALVELARRYLDSPERPQVGGERPHVTVTVDVDTLRELKRTAKLDHSGLLHPEAARRLACDASVTRVVLGPASEPLDVGRKTPVVPAALRRALVIRDRGCRFSGCRRPPAWCEAHHIKHWAEGGATSLSNCVLLCRWHHHVIHEEGFAVEMTDEGPLFRRPDGSVIKDNRAPP